MFYLCFARFRRGRVFSTPTASVAPRAGAPAAPTAPGGRHLDGSQRRLLGLGRAMEQRTSPAPIDDAVINVLNAGAAITISSKVESINSITAANPLVSRWRAHGRGRLDDQRRVDHDWRIADGRVARGFPDGHGDDDGLRLGVRLAEGGATLSLPQLTSYSGGGDYTRTTLQAIGHEQPPLTAGLATHHRRTPGFDALVQVGPSSAGDVELPRPHRGQRPTPVPRSPAGRPARSTLSQLHDLHRRDAQLQRRRPGDARAGLTPVQRPFRSAVGSRCRWIR